MSKGRQNIFKVMSTFFRILTKNMSENLITKFINNADRAESKLAELKTIIEDVRKVKIQEKIKELIEENAILAAKVHKTKAELIKVEIGNGKVQYSIPGKTAVISTTATESAEVKSEAQEALVVEKKDKDAAKKKEKSKNPPTSDSVIDVRKLDFRIGKIVDINKHPDADTLYVEKIDCGEETPRTVVSGLVNHIPIDKMRNRIVMVLCNLKPVKMRGVTSEAMVMCASSPEKVEVLLPPNGAVPGDLVSCEGYPREPEAQLNPKKKIFETCAPDLKTNSDKIACYKGSPLIVPGKGPVIAPSLKDVNVK